MIRFLIIISLIFSSTASFPQCCAVGGGSPIAGDAAIGVLKEKQFEISANYQYISSNKFLTETEPAENFLDNFSSKYLYTRLAYGLSERLTISVETGYWIDKTQIGLSERDTYSSKGIGDLILFPRYSIIQAKGTNYNELTVGMGFKIPLGSYNDSMGYVEPFSGATFYTTKPLAVQATSGAYDLLFNMFYTGRIPGTLLSISANALHIMKGWNPLSEKLGNYTSLGLFVGQTFYNNLNFTLQFKGEWIGKMEINPDMMMVRFFSYDPEATGSRKFFVAPQLSYVFADKLSVFLQSEIPVYQNVNKTQIASQTQVTAGLTYRFSITPGSSGSDQ